LRNIKERDHLEEVGVYGKIILKWLLRWNEMDWINLAHDREKCLTLSKRVINFRAP
jgi:hypothetical protein